MNSGRKAVKSDMGQAINLPKVYPSALLLTLRSSLPRTQSIESSQDMPGQMRHSGVLQSPNPSPNLSLNRVPNIPGQFHQSARLSPNPSTSLQPMSLSQHLKPIASGGLANGRTPKGPPTQPPPPTPTVEDAVCVMGWLLVTYDGRGPYPTPPPTPPPPPPTSVTGRYRAAAVCA